MSNKDIRIRISPKLILYNITDRPFSESYCDTLIIPVFKQISRKSIVKPEKILKKKLGKSSQDDAYKSISSVDGERIIYSDNCQAFRGEKGGTCLFCMREYEGIRHGYAVKQMDDGSYFTKSNYACSAKHAWARLQMMRIDNPEERDLYQRLTEKMYSEIYPGINFKSYNDQELLLSGACTYDEWNDDNNIFEPIKGVVVIPVKNQYLLVKKDKKVLKR